MGHLRTISLFIAVAEQNSFAGAARVLNISAPSATRGIGLLEEKLGVKLFQRTTRSLTLTDTGQFYLGECKRILADLKSAEDAVSGIYQSPKGHLRITSSVLFGENYVMPVITEFLTQYPDISVETLFVDRNVNMIDEGIDVAVRIGHLQDSNLVAIKVGNVKRVVCAAPSYLETNGIPHSLDDLKYHHIINARPISPNGEWHFADAKYARVKSRLEVNTMASAAKAAVRGWGLTQVLSYQISSYIENGQLQVVLADYETAPLPVNVICIDGRFAAMKVKAFVDYIKMTLQKDQRLV